MTPAGEARVIELLERLVSALERDSAPPSAFIDAAELARQLGVNVRTLRRMRHEGAIPEPVRVGRLVRWRRAEVERFLQGRKP